MIIQNYPEGSDITVLNTTYLYPKKDEETGKWSAGQIDIVYRDNVTGVKHVESIEDPDYLFYVANEGVNTENWNFFLPKDRVTPVLVPYRELEKNIAQINDRLNFYYDNMANGNKRLNQTLHAEYNIMSSDMHIEDHYRLRFSREYKNDVYPLNKAFFDIEVDTININKDFPELGEAPINAVTLIDLRLKTSYTFLLRNPDNPLIKEFEDSMGQDLVNELGNFVVNNVGGWKNATRMGIIDLKYNFRFYDEEIQLIQDLFILINNSQPDFLLAWNCAFDLPYIIERIKVLGYNPEEIMCHPDFKEKYVSYFIDERHANEFEERGDFCKFASYTVVLDQMIQFASRRKGQSKFTSYGLDNIGEVVAKVRKLDYHHITTDISKLPYLDYKTFVFYNIMDVIVQVCIEAKTGDIDYIFSKCLINNTRYSKGHRQTVYLTNRAAKEFYNMGKIIGNNINKFKPSDHTKIFGAFVSNPAQVTNYSKKKINGKHVWLFPLSDDFDFKALYPSIIGENNISPNTQVGKIQNIVCDYKPRFYDGSGEYIPYYTSETAFVEDLHSRNWIEFGHRWFGLASYAELYDDIIEFYTTKYNPSSGLFFLDQNNGVVPVFFLREVENNITEPVHFIDKDKPITPVQFFVARDYSAYDEVNRYLSSRIPDIEDIIS